MTDQQVDPNVDPQLEADELDRQQANGEAARYRTQLRAAEAERDTAHERIAKYQRAEVERILGTPREIPNGKKDSYGAATLYAFDVPGDIFDVAGRSLDDFFGEDGEIDEAKVVEALAEIAESRPRLIVESAPVAPVDPVAAALSRTRSITPGKQTAQSWVDALKPE